MASEQGVTPSAVSQHLTVLRANGLISRERVGRRVHYALTDSGRAVLRGHSGG